MAVVVFGKCKVCDDGVEVRLVSRNKSLCLYHHRELERDKKRIAVINEPLKFKPISPISEKQKLVNAEDEKFYRKIWRERKHQSEVSGALLPDKMERWFMSHILPKKNYPHFRHNSNNILLMTKPEHTIWEFGTPQGEKWDKVKELQMLLKDEYNKLEQEGWS